MNHHQIGLCDELYRLFGKKHFYFIEEEPLPLEKKELGYSNYSHSREYIISEFEDLSFAHKLLRKSDFVIVSFSQGSKTIAKFCNPIKTKVFWYMERLYKDNNPIKTILKFFRAKFYFRSLNGYDQYSLCASSYGYYDLLKTNKKRFFDKSFRFGYFPISCSNSYCQKRILNSKISFLFVGRLINWKKPLLLLDVFRKIYKTNKNFELYIVGDGPLYNIISKRIKKYNLSKNVFLIGSRSFDEIKEYYRFCNYFIFPSGKEEGWGAVLNEAMSYGCVPIANSKAGSTSWLVENKTNGYTFSKKNEMFLIIYKILNLSFDEYGKNYFSMSKKSQKTIIEKWNYLNFSKRLFNTILYLMNLSCDTSLLLEKCNKEGK